MKVMVTVFRSLHSFNRYDGWIARYIMDHDDPAQRRVLGEQVRNAFEAGQVVLTHPVQN